MSKPTLEQGLAVVSALVQNVNWDELNMDDLQKFVICNPTGAGAQLTLFLKNGCRVSIGDMKIATAPFDPVTLIGLDWEVIADEHDKRNDGVTEVDFNAVDFPTCLKEDESRVTGEDKLKRLKASGQILYGANAFMGTWKDYQSRKENSVLETLFRTKGITYLDFFGDVLLSPSGDRFVLYFCRLVDGGWLWRYNWLGNALSAKIRSVVSSQVSA
jgi:hypothetical protein